MSIFSKIFGDPNKKFIEGLQPIIEKINSFESEFEKFLKSDWELNILKENKIIFRSKKSGVRGLLDFLQENGKQNGDVVIFDKIVGRAAALLTIYLGAKEVYGGIGSNTAAQVFRRYKIKFYFSKTYPNILNKDKTDLCPMEKLSLNKNPEEFYNLLSKNTKC